MPGGPERGGRLRTRRGRQFSALRIEIEDLQFVSGASEVDPVIPPRRHRKDVSDRKGNELHNLTVVLRIEMPHGIAIDEIDRTSLPALNQKLLMKDAGRTIGQKKHTTGT